MTLDRGVRRTKATSTKRQPMDYEKQRRDAIRRDGKFCVAEIRIGRAAELCGAEANATAHIYRRWLCGPAADHVDVVIRACVECHDMLDGRLRNTKGVRFPIAAQRRAWDRIVSVSKDTKTIGPRP